MLFVFAWLVVGGEETEVRLLAKNLDPRRYRIDVVACFRKPGMPAQSHRQLAALGVDVDTTPYGLGFDETVAYLAAKIPGYDLVVACQNVPDIYPALERLCARPPLIEHGGLVSEALAGPKHFTSRYVGVCRYHPRSRRLECSGTAGITRSRSRRWSTFPNSIPPAGRGSGPSLTAASDTVLVGWVGRLDAKKRVEDFVEAAALACSRLPAARFAVIGGADAFMPDYADRLQRLAKAHGLSGQLRFLGDRPDVPRLLAALDIFVWLSRGEGMPHVIAEAGAAALPVIVTPDPGALQQVEAETSGLVVPHEDPRAVAAAIARLAADPDLRRRLGAALKRHVVRTYSATVVIPQWQALFDEVLRP